MLNAGAIRHIGPNRMWVEIARRWAAHGVPTLRLDLEGIGDADGDGERFTELAELYVPELVGQVRAALDAIEARGVGRRFVLCGLCSGAYWAFQGALLDERVTAAFLLNPQALFWDPSLEITRDFRRGMLRASSGKPSYAARCRWRGSPRSCAKHRLCCPGAGWRGAPREPIGSGSRTHWIACAHHRSSSASSFPATSHCTKSWRWRGCWSS